ncbi:MAG: tetratricopeptide repeat protein [Thermodesulfobacteriota bacterium]
MVQKNTLYLVALACLGLGFVAGVIFSAVRGGPDVQGPTAPLTTGTGDAEKTIALLNQVLAQEPQNYEAWVRLGNIHFDRGQHHQAIEAYEKALAINDGSADVWTDLGVMYRRHGQPGKAISSFDEASRRDPKHLTSLFNKGFVLVTDLNDPAGAIEAWEKAVAINPMAAAPNGEILANLIDELRQEMAAAKKAQEQPAAPGGQ